VCLMAGDAGAENEIKRDHSLGAASIRQPVCSSAAGGPAPPANVGVSGRVGLLGIRGVAVHGSTACAACSLLLAGSHSGSQLAASRVHSLPRWAIPPGRHSAELSVMSHLPYGTRLDGSQCRANACNSTRQNPPGSANVHGRCTVLVWREPANSTVQLSGSHLPVRFLPHPHKAGTWAFDAVRRAADW
jgi:hypothetical protein